MSRCFAVRLLTDTVYLCSDNPNVDLREALPQPDCQIDIFQEDPGDIAAGREGRGEGQGGVMCCAVKLTVSPAPLLVVPIGQVFGQHKLLNLGLS